MLAATSTTRRILETDRLDHEAAHLQQSAYTPQDRLEPPAGARSNNATPVTGTPWGRYGGPVTVRQLLTLLG